MLNFLRKVGNALIESRMNAAYYGVAGYIQREYNTGMTTGELVNMLRKDGFDEVVAKIR
jgi:hypothetical protein